MTNEVLSGVIGLFMPIVVELAKTKLPDKRWVSYSVSLGVSAVVGFLTTYFTFSEALDLANILGAIGAAFVASQSIYSYWFRDSKIKKQISKE